MRPDRVVGIDLGGTHARAGLFNLQGRLLALQQTPIEAHQGAETGVKRLIRLVEGLLEDSHAGQLAGIGMGCTGPLDTERGLIQNPYTLPGWANVPVIGPLSDHFHVPAFLENDAAAAALGEYWQGAGRGVARLYMVTVGTGIGTAFVYHGEIFRGLGGAHPEGGHLPVDPSGPECYCGQHGCWESLAAGPAIQRRAMEARPHFPDSTLAAGLGAAIDAHQVAQAAQAGDPLGVQVMGAVARDFSRGLAAVIELFLPEMIVLGGGVMQSLELFTPAIRETLQAINVMVPANQIQVVPARLGNQAGIYGAAYTALHRTGFQSDPSTL
jgi:glucokinase